MIKQTLRTALAAAMLLSAVGCKEKKANEETAAVGSVADVQMMRAATGDRTVFASGTRVVVDETNFPDEIFRAYVSEHIDRDQNGELDEEEILAVREIDVSDSQIVDLTGIEFFPTLECLKCYGNKLTRLDVSCNEYLQELYCGGNWAIKTLNLSHNKNLRVLNCNGSNGYRNRWDGDILDEYIDWCFSCGEGSGMIEVATTGSISMLDTKVLFCVSRGMLSALDVTQCPKLEYLDCSNTQLTRLDVSHNPALKYLVCRNVRLTSLAVAWNPSLQFLDCSSNELVTLDLRFNPALWYLNCASNELTLLGLGHNSSLEYIRCKDNRLTDLDVTQCPSLLWLHCSGNELATLDLSANPRLEMLFCNANILQTLDISHNPALYELECINNQMKTLDVSGNPELSYLKCSGNELEHLDVSACPKLKRLYCENTPPQEFDLSQNPELELLRCDKDDEVKGANEECDIEYDESGRFHIFYDGNAY